MSRLRREDVIEAASRLFAVHGYHGRSMRDLGTELGILGGSVYAHVSSKEELLVEVVHRAGRLFGEAAEGALTGSRSPSDHLEALIAGHIGIVLNHRDEVQTFLNEAAALDGAHRDRRRAGPIRNHFPVGHQSRRGGRYLPSGSRHRTGHHIRAVHAQRSRTLVPA